MEQAAMNALGATDRLPAHPALNRTFCLLKNDAYRRGLVGALIGRLETWFNIRAMVMLLPSRSAVEEHYKHHAGRSYFADLVDSMHSGRVVALVLHSRFGDVDAVRQLRELMGSYKAAEHVAGTIRADYMRPGDPAYLNLIHGSDSIDEAAREANIWFRFPDESDFYTC